MISQTVLIHNPTGLSVRPAGILCKTAMLYRSSIHFLIGKSDANAKSVLSVLGASVRSGEEIRFVCDGPDEEEALAAMVHAVEDGLGE